MGRVRPVVLAARTTQIEAQIIRTAASADGEPVSRWARRKLLAAAQDRLGRELDPVGGEGDR